MTRPVSGADALCDVLSASGVGCVFGVPGTQTVTVYDSLRRSSIRSVVATHELGAAFMASGYARTARRAGVLLTIPGPGFAYAIAGLAEAKLDGAPVVHLTLEPARGPEGAPAFQAIDQSAIARPLVKSVLAATERAALPGAVQDAIALAEASDPGPVLVEMCEQALLGEAEAVAAQSRERAAPATPGLPAFVDQITAARRPLIFVARECGDDATALAAVAAQRRIPVCVPAPSRGILPEDHQWCLCADDQRTRLETIQSVVDESDLVVVIGTRLNHVSTAGFRLKLASDRVICAAPVGATLPHGYKSKLTIEAEPAALLAQLAGATAVFASTWTAAEVRAWQERFVRERPASPPDPRIDGGTPQAFFSAVRDALPRDAIVVTDSGLHQVMVRRHLSVLANGGLMLPSDFQSMGFGLPAGIGAKLASPSRPVLVVMGDGGFAMSGMELLTAVREKVPVVVMVFNDGQLNLIRLQQLREFGSAHGVNLAGPDFEAFAIAVGARYRKVSGNVAAVLREALANEGPTLVEVTVGDSAAIRRVHATSAFRETTRRALGPRLVQWIKKLRG